MSFFANGHSDSLKLFCKIIAKQSKNALLLLQKGEVKVFIRL